ncbi:MAG TPA: diaminopimelate decarboxylase [Terriglobales bacterium]|nr:diaminopimelate decarboxylase [Terriglobales bacterium]
MRPPGFLYRNGQLHCDRIPLSRLAARFSTPLYVYSAATIRDRFRAFDAAFGDLPHTICYSIKANSSLSILRLLSKLGAGFDVVSGGELERVRRVHRHALANVVFSGVGKTAAEIDAALRARILLFNVESESELALLTSRAARLKKTARIALRVNPHVPAETHPYISTGLREHKFGIPIEDAPALYARAAREKFLQVAGVSVHIGSQITSLEPFALTVERLAELVRTLRSNGHRIIYVDAGGGLGIAYKAEDCGQQAVSAGEVSKEADSRAYGAVDDFRSYAGAVQRPLRGLNVHLILEPGRVLLGPAGVLLTRVLYLKRNGDKRFVVLDAGMNDLIRPALYNAYHEIVPAKLPAGDQRSTSADLFDIVGPVCETGDFFARDRRLPQVAEGDLLAVLDAGAYGMSLASNYNSRPRPAEVLVDGARSSLVRRRETAADLVRCERT